MPHHVIIDGSNLATEGRTAPSLKQLNEAVDAYRLDHPEALITVVVDATFGHRIDPKEVPAFERAIETNAFVAPPAGAIGRGDGFILSIAQKVKATVLSNDSYQEFHGEFAWLFDEGRLVGGKPVPHVGWVFVYRTPVRGPVSRRSVKEQKVVEKSPGRRRGSKQSTDLTALPALSANAPMPIPKSAPPGAVMPAQKLTTPKSVNDLMVFLSFVEHHPVGTTVEAVVDSYSSHGAYVLIGDAHGYLPLRLMGDPPPRSAREAVALGEVVTLVVHSFAPARRSIDLGVLAMSPDAKPPLPARPRRGDAKRAAAALSPDPKPTSKKASEAKTSEVKAAQVKAAEVKAAQVNAAQVNATEKKTVGKKADDKTASDNKTVEKKPAGKKTADKKQADKKGSLKKGSTKSAAGPVVQPPQPSTEQPVDAVARTRKSAAPRASRGTLPGPLPSEPMQPQSPKSASKKPSRAVQGPAPDTPAPTDTSARTTKKSAAKSPAPRSGARRSERA